MPSAVDFLPSHIRPLMNFVTSGLLYTGWASTSRLSTTLLLGIILKGVGDRGLGAGEAEHQPLTSNPYPLLFTSSRPSPRPPRRPWAASRRTWSAPACGR